VFAAEIGSHDSLWTSRDGTVELVAIDGLNNPPVPPQPAPGFGPGQVYAGLFGGLINDSDHIAMLGVVWNPGGQFGIRAIWADHSGNMSLIVRRGDPVPGASGLLFTNTINTRGYGPDGTIYFSALVDEDSQAFPSSASNYGLFIAEPDGAIHTVVLTGRSFEVAPGDIRTVAQVFPSFNEPNLVPGSISDGGTIVFQLTFTDGTTGLFTAGVAPRPVPGDLDGDGSVGIVDLLALLAAWGPCPDPPAGCPADLDGDGSVGITDFLILLSNWSP
jgi:dockerin type I repeat protein